VGPRLASCDRFREQGDATMREVAEAHWGSFITWTLYNGDGWKWPKKLSFIRPERNTGYGEQKIRGDSKIGGRISNSALGRGALAVGRRWWSREMRFVVGQRGYWMNLRSGVWQSVPVTAVTLSLPIRYLIWWVSGRTGRSQGCAGSRSYAKQCITPPQFYGKRHALDNINSSLI
jgi:hypothetical protein